MSLQHINKVTLDDPMVFAGDWLCECGQRANPVSPEWRWNGSAWEHHHGYPIGHVETRRAKQEIVLVD